MTARGRRDSPVLQGWNARRRAGAVEILCTGDEILTGKTINTNYSHMARRWARSGWT
jgi:hypothetical protein